MRDLVYEIAGLLPKTVTFVISKALKISEDMDTEVDEAAYLFGFYAVLAEKAETKHQKLKFNFESWRAGAESNENITRSTEGKKSHTEAQMKAVIMSQPKFRLYQKKLIEVDEQRRILKVISKALEMKKDLVQTKSSNRRNELKGGR